MVRLLTLFLSLGAALAAVNTKVQRLQKSLAKTMAKSSEAAPIVEVDVDTYTNLVLKAPKPYHLFVFMGAKEEVCRYCPPFKSLFEHVAKSYYYTDQHEVVKGKDPVFFIYVDIMENQKVSEIHGIRGLPSIIHVHSSKGLVKKKNGKLMFKDRDMFPLRKLETPASEMLDWANNQAGGRDVPLYYTPSEKFFRGLKVVGILLLAVVFLIGMIFACRRWNALVCLIAMLVQYVSTSGLFYNILQGMQWAGVDDKGNVQYIMPGTRGQYLAEGLFMSGCSLCTGLLLLIACRAPFNSTVQSLFGGGTLTWMQVVAMGLAYAALWTVFAGYKTKSGWYQEPTFYPPSWYKTGPVGVDQGNSF